MKKIFNQFIVYGLSILFLSGMLHVDLHDHKQYDGYNICAIDCDDENHRFNYHECDKCLKKNNRFIVQSTIELFHNKYRTSFFFINQRFDHRYFIFKLFSRPPPDII